jgi:UDP-N-acetylglucosamine acyltransferase
MAVEIHERALVHPQASLGENVSVGPFSYIGEGVEVGDGSRVLAHATLLGPTRIGKRATVFPYATLGAPPQDRSYDSAPTELFVGDGVTFREQVTVHRGTEKGGGLTRIESGCLLMVGVHVAHDCHVERDVVLTNLTLLGGHVRVGARATLGGQVIVAPFTTLGRLCFVAGGARVETDVPPFSIVQGDRARVRGLNKVGLARAEVSPASQAALKRAYRKLFCGAQPRALAAAELANDPDPLVAELCRFLLAHRG